MKKKNVIFGQAYLKFYGCHGTAKNDGHTIDISKFPQRMKEQLLEVSAPLSKLPFKSLQETL